MNGTTSDVRSSMAGRSSTAAMISMVLLVLFSLLRCGSAGTQLIPDIVDNGAEASTVGADVTPEVELVSVPDVPPDGMPDVSGEEVDLSVPCVPDCEGKSCGESDGCDGYCFSAESCDDGIECTLDVCVPLEGQGCAHHPLGHMCEGNGACAAASCKVGEGCIVTPKEGSCDDGDLCTRDDQCVEGECQGTALEPLDDCDDNNECTLDTCDSQTGCQHEPWEGACDLSLEWLAGHCADGLCVPDSVTAVVCQNNDNCLLLENDNPCDGTFICGESGHCEFSAASIPDCSGATTTNCQANVCQPDTGQCAPVPANEGLPCSDEDACTTGDVCQAGDCLPGAVSLSCWDDNQCTEDSCSPDVGCVFTVKDGSCDDGNPCSTADLCAGGACMGQQYLCDDGLDCTIDVCDGAGGCSFSQIESGRCLIGGTCYDADDLSASDACLACVPQQSQVGWSYSAPGLACIAPHAQGGCLDGECLVAKCQDGFDNCDDDDDNGCETDVKDDFLNCGKCGVPCLDGQACHDNQCVETCPEGEESCAGSCPDLTLDAENCGECQHVCTTQDASMTGVCLDGDCGQEACPDGVWDLDGLPGNGCEYPCTDTGPEQCDGVDNDCDGEVDETSCDDGIACTVDVCNVQTGCHNAPLDMLCEDLNVCTTQHCDVDKGCVYSDAAGNCDDNDPCTLDDQCQSGVCSGAAVAKCCLADADCDDSNPCTMDSCDGDTLQCLNEASMMDGIACDLDGDGCTLDACQSGVCTQSGAVDCTGKAGECQTGACLSGGPLKFQCLVEQVPEGTGCDDGLFCTSGDACDAAGECVAQGATDCGQEAGQCGIGICDELADQCVVVSLPDETPCDADGDGCTVADACQNGQCAAGPQPDCSSAGDECNPGVCESLGANLYQCGTAPGPAGVDCDDGLFCTVDDKCDAIGGCAGSPMECPGLGEECIAAKCNEGAGACVADAVEDGTLCDDGSSCTLVDVCTNGVCTGTADGCSERRLNAFTSHVTFHNPVEWTAGAQLAADRGVAVWRSGSLGIDARIFDGELTLLAPALVLTDGWPPQPGNCGTTMTRQATAASPTGDWLVVSGYKWRNIATQNCGYSSKKCIFTVNYSLSFKVLDKDGVVVREWTDMIHDKNVYTHSTGYWGCNCSCGQSEMPAPQAIANDQIVAVGFSDGSFGIIHKLDAGAYQYFRMSPELEVSPPVVLDPGGVMNLPSACRLPGDQLMVTWHSSDNIAYARYFDKEGVPAGDAVAVSETQSGNQYLVSCDSFSDGKSVVSFSSCAAGGPCQVHAQLLKPSGALHGPTVIASQTADGIQRVPGRPRVLSDDSFVVTWEEAGSDADGYGVWGRVYEKSLSPVTDALRLNNEQNSEQVRPVILPLQDSLVALWDSQTQSSQYDVYFRKFGNDGQAQSGSPQRHLSDTVAGKQFGGDVAATGSGFVAVWESEVVDGDGTAIAARVFSEAGVPESGDLQVNQYFSGAQSDPAVAWQEAAGALLVSWTSHGQVDETDVFVRTMDGAGQALGDELQVNTVVAGAQEDSDVAALPGGGFVVVWQGYANEFFLTEVYARLFDGAGAAQGAPFVVNGTAAGDQLAPAVAGVGGDNPGFIAGWTQTGDDSAVLIRRFDVDGAAVGSEVVVDVFGQPDEVTLDWYGGQLLVCWTAGGKILCQPYDDQMAPAGGQAEPVVTGAPANPKLLFRDENSIRLVFDADGNDLAGRGALRLELAVSGAASGAVGLLNWSEAGDQHTPFAARLANGQMAVGWTDSQNDGDGSGVFLRVLH